ncbi:MAG TPA: NHLP bacteriocin export ABC transporter permease/ATPase subunit [Elusimicrobiota bacterium]|nr:NHLP bacteriocin export ABC transporter permease/ATPase subunit [Elusimicrobiota bacterium]
MTEHPIPKGEALELAGNRPLPLLEPGVLFVVESGQVDIFAVKMEKGVPVGPRQHLITAGPKQAFFGAHSTEDGLGLLAVGGLGTRAVTWDARTTSSLLVQPNDDIKHAVRDYARTVGAFFASDGNACKRLEEGPFSAALVNEVQTLLLKHASHLFKTTETRDQERLARKLSQDGQLYQKALNALADIITSTTDAEVVDDDALFAALQSVGRAAGIKFSKPAPSPDPLDARFRIEDICRTCNIKFRRVVLRGDWWLNDCGPLLGLLSPPGAEENAQSAAAPAAVPVALLPVSGSRYEIFNPADGSRRPADRATLKDLQPFAYVFYKPFPDRKLSFWDIVSFIGAEGRSDAIALAALAVASALLGLVTPLVTGRLFDSVIPNAERGDLVQFTVALVAAAAATGLFNIAQGFATLRLNTKWESGVQAALWDRLLRLPAPFFRQFTVGDLSERVGAINVIRQVLGVATLGTIFGGLTGLFNFVLLFKFSTGLALWACVIVAVAVTIYGTGLWLSLKVRENISALEGKISGLVFQLLGGIAKLKVSASERRGFAVWSRHYAAAEQLNNRAAAYDRLMQVFNAVLPVFSSLVIYWLVDVSSARSGTSMGLGDFVAFNTAFTLFLASAISMSSTAFEVVNIVPVWKRARPIMDALPETGNAKPQPRAPQGRIDMNHVTFRYKPDGPKILDDVSFSVKPGEFVALVGQSGSGKSTIMRVLLGFETPEVGAVYYDGQDLSKYDVASLRRHIGVVLQNGRLLSGDILSNIIGSLPLTEDDAWRAAEMSGVADDIRQMPMGMHTVVNEGGSTLSGGQRQRIIIARALVRAPKSIYFDEATSALDNRTQAIVTESLDKMHVTRVVIAHRLSTVRHADRILVLEKGRIVQQGSFEELVQQPGLFKEMALRQVADS